MRLDGDEWRTFFDGFQRSAWRLELHPVYTMPGERETFARFMAGERADPTEANEWTDRVRHYRRTGRVIGRVHVVRRPLSDYLRYEFEWWYQANVQAGEDIRILDLTDRADPGLGNEDFWLFDERHVVLMRYRPDGTQIVRDMLEQPDVETFLRYRDTAMRNAVPFAEYWSG
jgi:hypothetical protein